MNLPEIKYHVNRAVNKFYANDSNLLSKDSSEWSVAHRIAIYLENEIPGWNVDCEYNRQGDTGDPKVNSDGVVVRPDIILHHRGFTDLQHNLIIIEIKKYATDSDYEKVLDFTRSPEGERDVQYQFGLTLALINEPIYHWFSNGFEV